MQFCYSTTHKRKVNTTIQVSSDKWCTGLLLYFRKWYAGNLVQEDKITLTQLQNFVENPRGFPDVLAYMNIKP